jgi:hypothetical protein
MLALITAISYRIEFPYKPSTCALMYGRQRPHLYYGGENLKYYLTPSPPYFLTRRAALRTNSIGPQPSHNGEGWGAVYLSFSCLCLQQAESTIDVICAAVSGWCPWYDL